MQHFYTLKAYRRENSECKLSHFQSLPVYLFEKYSEIQAAQLVSNTFKEKEQIKRIKTIIPQLHSPDPAHNLSLSPLIPVRHSYSGRKKVNKY